MAARDDLAVAVRAALDKIAALPLELRKATGGDSETARQADALALSASKARTLAAGGAVVESAAAWLKRRHLWLTANYHLDEHVALIGAVASPREADAPMPAPLAAAEAAAAGGDPVTAAAMAAAAALAVVLAAAWPTIRDAWTRWRERRREQQPRDVAPTPPAPPGPPVVPPWAAPAAAGAAAGAGLSSLLSGNWTWLLLLWLLTRDKKGRR